MVVRCTRKALDFLGAVAPTDMAASEEDWYLGLLWVDGRRCLLLVHAGTLFSVFIGGVRKAEVRPIGPYLVGAIEAGLRAEGLAAGTFGRLDPDAVELGRTASRSVLGFMNEIAAYCRHDIAAAGGLGACDPAALNRRLQRRLHNQGGYFSPIERVRGWSKHGRGSWG